MAGKYADYQLDIHGGGADLAFPHHENEVAQSEAFSGKPFARYWMHNGFITVGASAGDGDEKMGKSKGNAFWLRDAFAIAPPAALRLWVLGTHYRMPLAYRADLLPQNAAALGRLLNACEALTRALAAGGQAQAAPATTGAVADKIKDIDARFRAAMDDDFNTPQALAAVYELATAANAAVAAGAKAEELSALWAALSGLLGVLGLPLAAEAGGGKGDVDGFMKLIIAIRKDARAAKNFALSDQIRDGLAALGVELNDRAGETTWKMK